MTVWHSLQRRKDGSPSVADSCRRGNGPSIVIYRTVLSAVGTATRYGLGIESRWGGDIFRTSPDLLWGPPRLIYNGYRVFPGGVKRPGRGVDHPPPSRAEVKERVELFLYSPLGLRGLVLGYTLS